MLFESPNAGNIKERNDDEGEKEFEQRILNQSKIFLIQTYTAQ